MIFSYETETTFEQSRVGLRTDRVPAGTEARPANESSFFFDQTHIYV